MQLELLDRQGVPVSEDCSARASPFVSCQSVLEESAGRGWTATSRWLCTVVIA